MARRGVTYEQLVNKRMSDLVVDNANAHRFSARSIAEDVRQEGDRVTDLSISSTTNGSGNTKLDNKLIDCRK